MATGTDVTGMLTEGVQEFQPTILIQSHDDGYRGKKPEFGMVTDQMSALKM
jgi:hypothetical protein